MGTKRDLLNQPDLKLFVQETLQRLFSRSPRFVRIWHTINWILLTVGGIPTLLTLIGVSLPFKGNVQEILEYMTLAGAWGRFMSGFTVEKVTQEVAPLTVKKQIQKEDKIKDDINNALGSSNDTQPN